MALFKTRMGARHVACWCLGWIAVSGGPRAAQASDPLCRAAPPVPPVEKIDAAITAADALVTEYDRPRARALYLAVLARDPNDEEAAIGLARTDAADGCYALAERGYRSVLARSPSNVEARAGLSDVLLWTGRWSDARDVLDRGILLAPFAPELLSRRARVASWSGDVSASRVYLAEAARVSPLDPEVKEARDRAFVGQARLGHRAQVFPAGFDDFQTTDASASQRWRRIRFEAAMTVMSRHGATRETRSGPQKTTLIDGRPSAGAYYHFENGRWLGGSLGFSVPALALPRLAVAATGFTPITRVFSLQGTLALWRYRADRDVILVAPALNASLSDAWDVTLRYWLTTVIVHDGSLAAGASAVSSVGLRIAYRPDARTSVGVDYTFGVQLERNPSATELLTLRSHIVTLLGSRMITSTLGVDLAVALERRENLANGLFAFGPAVEAGVLTRW